MGIGFCSAAATCTGTGWFLKAVAWLALVAAFCF
jgi:hypothetical protein